MRTRTAIALTLCLGVAPGARAEDLAGGPAAVLAAITAPLVRADEALDGFTEPFRKVELAPLEPGVLRKVLVEEGARVKAGQLLASLDDEVLQVSLKIAKQVVESRGKYDAAKAERNLRAERLARLRALQPLGHVHREEVDRAAADLEVAEANLMTIEEQKALDALEYQKTLALLQRRQIQSPLGGVVTKVHHEAGEYLSSANPVVFTIVQLNPLRVVFAVPVKAARGLAPQQPVQVRFPESNVQCKGQVELVAPVIDAESSLVRVKVLIANPDEKYPCGAHCQLILDAAQAVAQSGGGD